MKYIERIIDRQIDQRIKAFNAISIVGPKGCGKTTSAKQKAHSVIEFKDEENRDNYLMLVKTRSVRLRTRNAFSLLIGYICKYEIVIISYA